MKLSTLAMAAGLACFAGPAAAQVVQTYTYDANGRLIATTRTQSSTTHTSDYVYDEADNRVSVTRDSASSLAQRSVAAPELAAPRRRETVAQSPAPSSAPSASAAAAALAAVPETRQ